MPDFVTDNRERNQYEITIDGWTSVLRYVRRPGVINLMHTEVPPELRGRGLANALVKAALDSARDAGVRVIATCPFVTAYLTKHPEYQPLVAPPRDSGS